MDGGGSGGSGGGISSGDKGDGGGGGGSGNVSSGSGGVCVYRVPAERFGEPADALVATGKALPDLAVFLASMGVWHGSGPHGGGRRAPTLFLLCDTPVADWLREGLAHADTERLSMLCARRNLDMAARLRRAHLAALDELGIAALEIDIARRAEEDALLAGLVAMVEEWEREGCPC